MINFIGISASLEFIKRQSSRIGLNPIKASKNHYCIYRQNQALQLRHRSQNALDRGKLGECTTHNIKQGIFSKADFEAIITQKGSYLEANDRSLRNNSKLAYAKGGNDSCRF